MLERGIRFVLLIAIAATSLAPFALRAQAGASDIHIKLVASSGVPLTGALVALINSDSVAAEGLSSASGTITLHVAPGTYRVRVRRIGFRPYFSEAVSLPSSKLLELKVETDRVVLAAIVVSATKQCGAITSDAETLSLVWDEIAKALRASQLTLDDLRGIGYAKSYKRQVGLRNEVISTDTTLIPVRDTRPFAAVDPQALVKLGFVRGDRYNGWDYFGPDEAVLLSNDFAATHCFKVVRERTRSGQIGVAFEPAPRRKQSDIKGVLWVDEKTAELRDVVFEFVNAGIISKFDSGGFTRFMRMPSGAWIVSDWQLRMPRIEVLEGRHEQFVLKGFYENGGLVVAMPGTAAPPPAIRHYPAPTSTTPNSPIR